MLGMCVALFAAGLGLTLGWRGGSSCPTWTRPAVGRAVTVRPGASGDGYLDSKSATPKNLKDLRSQAVTLLIIMIDSKAVR